MKYTLPIAILCAVAATFSLEGKNYYQWQIFCGSIVCILFISAVMMKRFHIFVGLAWGWTMLSLLQFLLSPIGSTIKATGGLNAQLKWAACVGVIVFMLTTIPFMALDPKKWRKIIFDVISVVCAANCVYVICQWAYGYHAFIRGGFFFNASMNASMIALMSPIMFDNALFKKKYINLIKYALPIIAVLLSDSTVGYGALGGMFALYAFIKLDKYSLTKRLIVMTSVLTFGAIFAYINLDWQFGDTSGRSFMWYSAMVFWKENAGIFIGHGQGSAMTLLPLIQHMHVGPNRHVYDYFIWFHNDWLQIVFEQGIVGAFFWIGSFIVGLWRTIKARDSVLVITLLILSFVLLVNYPARMFVPGMVVAAIGYLALTSRSCYGRQ